MNGIAAHWTADAMVADVGGRVYPAKDARMSPAMFQRFYPRWRELEAARDPAISSSFWRRVTVAVHKKGPQTMSGNISPTPESPRRRGPLSWSAPPAVAQAAIRRWAAQGKTLALVGRAGAALQRVAADARCEEPAQ